MTFPVFLDACVLFGQALCDTVLSIAETRAFVPYWSNDVLDEVQRVVPRSGRASPDQIRDRVVQIRRAFPNSLVEDYEVLIPAMTNDDDDRHVLAACVASPARTLITFNEKHFPPSAVKPHDISVLHPDEFLLDQLDLHPDRVWTALATMLERNRMPPRDLGTLATYLDRSGVPGFAEAIRSGHPD